jgi:ribosomal protein L37E
MDNLFEMTCPRCGHSDMLDVAAIVQVRLTRDGTDADQSDSADHTWDDDSACSCAHCGWEGTVFDASPGGNECAAGIHSWIGEKGKLPPDTPCTRCGELYGDPT